MADVVVGIHQPNFLPWPGFFHKLASSDVFVLLDTVQFSRRARINRVQVLTGGKATWLTVPVRRHEHEPLLADALVDDSHPWRRKALHTLQINYGSLPGFGETVQLIEPILNDTTERLALFNENAIRRLASALSIQRARLVRASELDVPGVSSERLAALTAAVGGTVYLSGPGAGGYLEEKPFTDRGLELRIQQFSALSYPQRAPEPVPGLSIVDAMMSLGMSGTRQLLQANGAPA
jgi:WbqC-like protein family